MVCGCAVTQHSHKLKKRRKKKSDQVKLYHTVVLLQYTPAWYITLAFVTGKMVAAQLSCIISCWSEHLYEKVMDMHVDGGADFHFQNFSVLFFILFIQDIQFQWVDIRYALSV